MKKRNLMFLVALSLLLTGCRAADTTIHVPPSAYTEIPQETEPAAAIPEAPALEAPAPEQQFLRLRDVPEWLAEAVMADLADPDGSETCIPSAWITDVAGLESLLERLGSDTLRESITGWDETIFGSWGLLAIPRVTTSGSVRHSVELMQGDDGLEAHVEAELPEMGTADMTVWMLLVPVPLSDSGDLPVTAHMPSGWQPMPESGLAAL